VELGGLIIKISNIFLDNFNIYNIDATVAELKKRYNEMDLDDKTIIDAYNKAITGNGQGKLIYSIISS